MDVPREYVSVSWKLAQRSVGTVKRAVPTTNVPVVWGLEPVNRNPPRRPRFPDVGTA